MAYFDTKKGSLEEAIKAAVSGQINEATVNFQQHDGSNRDFQNLVKKNRLKIKTSGDGSQTGKGNTTVVTGDPKNIEKMLNTMYGNDWKDFYKVKGGDYIEEKVELEEGTTKVPTSMADFRGIMNLMKKPIKAKDAEKAVSKYIDDDYLANGIISIKQKDPNADARPAIMRGFNKLEISTMGEPSYGSQIKFNRNFEISDKRQKTLLQRSSSEDKGNMTRITLRGGAKVRAEELDPVNKTAVKKKFDDRKDKDIDNDGDVDASDKYLHKRRKAVSKAMKSEDYLDEKNQIKPNATFDFELFSSEKGSKKANDDMTKEIKKAAKMKDYKTARTYMSKVQDKYEKLGANDSEPDRTINAILGMVFPNDPDRKKHSFDFREDKVNKEAFEYGTPEATKNSLNMTPGQSTDDWNKQVGIMQQRQSYMRETLAKIWEVEEGHNPFKKDIDERFTRLKSADLAKARKKAGMPPFKKGGYTSAELKKFYDDQKKNKKEDKTMTGKPMTKVAVGSEKDD